MMCPVLPNPNEKASATFFRELLRYVQSITILPSPGVRVTRGPNGTRLGVAPSGGARSVATVDTSCWSIEWRANDGGTPAPYFRNRYYAVGAVLAEVEDDVPVPEPDGESVICLKVATTPTDGETPTAEVVTYTDFAAATADSQDPEYAIRPLYMTDEDGKICADLRNLPTFQSGETL